MSDWWRRHYKNGYSKNSIDTSYLNFKDIDGFKRSCKIVKDLGFGGKACIHPNQIEISNEIFNENIASKRANITKLGFQEEDTCRQKIAIAEVHKDVRLMDLVKSFPN